HFVEIRSLPGGPSPREMKRMITERRKQQAEHLNWLTTARKKGSDALRHLDEVISGWSEE
ncbi:hypothetical protein MXD63_35160, partial [Frankia sp. Cpl3]|nr:hypothetical protein [Frankia sp. Cpl3]